MAAIELNFNPSNKQLRQFGLIGLCALPIVGWLFAGKPTPSTWDPSDTQRVTVFAVVGMMMGISGLARPGLLKWLFVAASVITYPIGFVLGEVVMFTIYITVFAPVALLFRIIGRDALERTMDSDEDSYWRDKQQPKNPASYFRQS